MTTSGQRLTEFFGAQRNRVTRNFDRGPEALLTRVGLNPRDALSVNRIKSRLGSWSNDTKRAVTYSFRQTRDQHIRVDPDLNRLVTEYLAIAAPPVLAAIEAHFIPLAEHAVAHAPVRTGRLRDGLTLDLRATDDAATVSFISTASYTFLVRYADRNPNEFDRSVEARVRQLGGPSVDNYKQAADDFNESPFRVESAVRKVRNAEPYQKPGGAPVGPKDPFWQVQARRPFEGAVKRMSATVEAGLAKLVAGVD